MPLTEGHRGPTTELPPVPIKTGQRFDKNDIVCMGTDGFAYRGDVYSSRWCIGTAADAADNTNGPDGAVSVIPVSGTTDFDCAGITSADVGKTCWVDGPYAVSLRNGGRSVCGIIVGFGTDVAWVSIQPSAMAAETARLMFYGAGRQGDLVNVSHDHPIYATNYTLETGHTLRPTFFQFCVLDTFQCDGTIDCKGTQGPSTSTLGTDGISSGKGGPATDGTTGPGNIGSDPGDYPVFGGGNGNGGDGGSGGAGAGGAGFTPSTASRIDDILPGETDSLLLGLGVKAQAGLGGAGGGAGAGDGASAAGGQGGGGGESGLNFIMRCRRFVLGATGTIDVRGGDGDPGTDGVGTGGATGGGGGGSGGGGGQVMIFCDEFVNLGGQILVDGGNGGAGGHGANGGGDGTAGASGTPGLLEIINLRFNTVTDLP